MTEIERLSAALCEAVKDPKLSMLSTRELAMLLLLARHHQLEPANDDDDERYGFSTKDLAAALGVRKPVITRATQRLSRDGLVDYEARRTDLRLRSIGINDRGLELARTLAKHVHWPPPLAVCA